MTMPRDPRGVWINPAPAGQTRRDVDEKLDDLVRALARRMAAVDHAAEQRGAVSCASQSTAVIVPTSKIRGR